MSDNNNTVDEGENIRSYISKSYPGATPGDKNWDIGLKEYSNGGKKIITKKPDITKVVIKKKPNRRRGLGENLSKMFEDEQKRRARNSYGQ